MRPSQLPLVALLVCAPLAAQEQVVAFKVVDSAPGQQPNISASSTPTLGQLYPMTSNLFVEDGSGEVGIGTTSPQARLDVIGAIRAFGANFSGTVTSALNIVNGRSEFNGRVGIDTSAPIVDFDIAQRIWMGRNPFGLNETAMMTHHPDGTRAAYIGPFTATQYVVGVLEDTGQFVDCGVEFNEVTDQSSVFATVKNFRETNPRNPETDIVYACVEGPEAAAYLRGTAMLVDGYARIDFPTHFFDVALSEGMTVHVTPHSVASRGMAVVERANTHIVVRELMNGSGTYEFDWEVKAVRRGFENYEVIRPKQRIPEMRTSVATEPVVR
ncbi:MAG: hypothetical protein AAGG01_10635 [Planctomycetota bacterium]